ncbi:hypothetical protein LUZ60_009623 [Juncus effusus]|nr:hypothetical protein LUZ60_009623 [Juncus effusus]
MEFSPSIQRQGSCGCASIRRGNYNYEELSQLGHVSTRQASNKLHSLWRKILREKKKILRKSAGNAVSASYDPYTYAQNFDEGPADWEEQENLSRSFSARFAVPSRFFEAIEVD